VRQTTSCMACTSFHMLSHFSNSTATNKIGKKKKSMRLLQVPARCFVLDFDSLAEDLVAELRNRHIELDLLDQHFTLLFRRNSQDGCHRERAGRFSRTSPRDQAIRALSRFCSSAWFSACDEVLTEVTSLSGQMT
jgi:hypothetical protein